MEAHIFSCGYCKVSINSSNWLILSWIAVKSKASSAIRALSFNKASLSLFKSSILLVSSQYAALRVSSRAGLDAVTWLEDICSRLKYKTLCSLTYTKLYFNLYPYIKYQFIINKTSQLFFHFHLRLFPTILTYKCFVFLLTYFSPFVKGSTCESRGGITFTYELRL